MGKQVNDIKMNDHTDDQTATKTVSASMSTEDLGQKSIGRLLAQYSVPAIIASVATSLYNIVDSIFIGRGVGPMAIAGLAITFPVMNLSAALGVLIGAGGSARHSV